MVLIDILIQDPFLDNSQIRAASLPLLRACKTGGRHSNPKVVT